jgi:hypothetical protein
VPFSSGRRAGDDPAEGGPTPVVSAHEAEAPRRVNVAHEENGILKQKGHPAYRSPHWLQECGVSVREKSKYVMSAKNIKCQEFALKYLTGI